MKSSTVGKDTSNLEVSNISRNGFWLLLNDSEYFLSFNDFPWFKHANVESILNVEMPHPEHLHWPSLDVDLELECIESPAKYPLVYKQRS